MRNGLLAVPAPRPAGVERFHGANYDREPGSAADARQFVAGALDAWNLGRFSDDAELIVTELVSNAIAHAEGDGMRVTIDLLAPGAVRIGVIDRSSEQPHLRPATPDQEGGRGMYLVAALSTHWGVDVLPGGKRVWTSPAHARRSARTVTTSPAPRGRPGR